MSEFLCSKDGSAFSEIVGSDNVPLLLVCDHASNRVPAQLGDMGGLSRDDFNRHIAWDIGAAQTTKLIAARLNCSAVLCRFSRLVVDVNRHPTDSTFIPESSDGVQIPANHGLSEADRLARQSEIFTPYQKAVGDSIRRLERGGSLVTVVAIHSFTPQLQGMKQKRPWHMGVVWNQDTVTSQRLLSYLRQTPNLTVGDNEPYSMKTQQGYTLEHHAEGKRPNVLLEIRNDLIGDKKGTLFYADLISRFFESKNFS